MSSMIFETENEVNDYISKAQLKENIAFVSVVALAGMAIYYAVTNIRKGTKTI